MAQLHIAFAPDAFGILEEFLVPRQIVGIELGDFARQFRIVVRVIEIGPVVPVQAVERHHGDQLDILVHLVIGQPPQRAQAIGIGDDGGARVEGKTVTLPEIGAPAGLVAPFDQSGGNARCLQTYGKGKPAETGADHGGALGFRLCFGIHRSTLSEEGAPIPASTSAAFVKGTGGLPASTRAISAVVLPPA